MKLDECVENGRASHSRIELLEAPMLTIVVRFKLQEGKEAEFEGAAAEQVRRVQENEPGTLLYTLLHSQTESTEYVFLEAYRDDAAFAAHGAESQRWWRPTYQSFIARPNVVERLDDVAGFGRDATWPA
jgi:quinol monooxygenase YgiN